MSAEQPIHEASLADELAALRKTQLRSAVGKLGGAASLVIKTKAANAPDLVVNPRWVGDIKIKFKWDLEDLCKDLREPNCGLETLQLAGNELGDDDVKQIAEALAQNSHLKHLCLWGNHVGEDGCKALAKFIAQSKSLQTLELWGNKVNDAGVAAIMTSFHATSPLVKLDLGQNQFGDEGALAIAKGLKQLKSLKHIDVRYNNIGEKGANALLDAAKDANLESLDIRYNTIPAAIREQCRARKVKSVLVNHGKQQERKWAHFQFSR